MLQGNRDQTRGVRSEGDLRLSLVEGLGSPGFGVRVYVLFVSHTGTVRRCSLVFPVPYPCMKFSMTTSGKTPNSFDSCFFQQFKERGSRNFYSQNGLLPQT